MGGILTEGGDCSGCHYGERVLGTPAPWCVGWGSSLRAPAVLQVFVADEEEKFKFQETKVTPGFNCNRSTQNKACAHAEQEFAKKIGERHACKEDSAGRWVCDCRAPGGRAGQGQEAARQELPLIPPMVQDITWSLGPCLSCRVGTGVASQDFAVCVM